jgi:hypothetical protein
MENQIDHNYLLMTGNIPACHQPSIMQKFA